jgi:branched-chain amino acid transport system permease protein
MGNWYQGHTLLLDFVMSSSIGAMSYQIALRSGLFAFISAGFWGVGAYAAADIAMKTSYPWALGILIGIVLSAAGGLLLSLLLLRLSGLYLGMATFAFDLVAGVIAQHAGPLTGGAGGLQPIPQDVSVPMMFGIFVVVCLLISQLEVGPLGRSQELIHFDQDLARSLGIRVTAWRHWIFILSAVLGSLSGSLYALTFLSISPSSIGFSTLITGLATVVVGGVASWRGCVIGAIIVIGVPNLFNNLQIWEPVIYGGLLLVVAVFMPEGIFGLWRRLTAAVGDRAQPGRLAGSSARPAMADTGNPAGE